MCKCLLYWILESGYKGSVKFRAFKSLPSVSDVFSKAVRGKEKGTELEYNDVLTRGNEHDGIDRHARHRTPDRINFIAEDVGAEDGDDVLHDADEYGVKKGSGNERAHEETLGDKTDRTFNDESGHDKGSTVQQTNA